METGALATFSKRENFYVILRSAAAGLTGLQFVVIALVADRRAAGSLRCLPDPPPRGRAVRRGWDRSPSIVHRNPQRLGLRHLDRC
jgi:hypothetical protein